MTNGLRKRLAEDGILLAPGVYDGLSALLADQAGAEAVYLSGASIAYTRFGRPDLGLVAMTEVADTLAQITDRVGLPVIVDADNGYGNALNVQRCVRIFERAGAGAIQLEDQALPKRCGHLDGKQLISTGEMTGKVNAAIDARDSTDTLIIARTDAIAVEGLEAALERADAYLEAGADVLFIEAPKDRAAMATINERFAGRAPLLANMVEGGKTELLSAAELEKLGYSIVIFPGGLVRALSKTAQAYFESLIENGTTEPFLDRMSDFAELNQIIGTPEMMKTAAKYDSGENS
ncbi:MAG: oxaloacetate decarboxylase [Rhizobiaceae bacterium]